MRDWKGGTTEEQKWELYIPSGVKAENELFNGFGRDAGLERRNYGRAEMGAVYPKRGKSGK